MKKCIAILLALSMLFALAACSGEPATTDGEGTTVTDSAEAGNENLTEITFALDWTPNTNHTGLYVAKALGYFEEAGLDVDIVFVDGSSSAQLCAAGTAQFAIEAQDTMAAALTGDEPLGITAVAAVGACLILTGVWMAERRNEHDTSCGNRSSGPQSEGK